MSRDGATASKRFSHSFAAPVQLAQGPREVEPCLNPPNAMNMLVGVSGHSTKGQLREGSRHLNVGAHMAVLYSHVGSFRSGARHLVLTELVQVSMSVIFIHANQWPPAVVGVSLASQPLRINNHPCTGRQRFTHPLSFHFASLRTRAIYLSIALQHVDVVVTSLSFFCHWGPGGRFFCSRHTFRHPKGTWIHPRSHAPSH